MTADFCDDWADEVKSIPDFRVRSILKSIATVLVEEHAESPSRLMLLNDLYTWIVEEKPSMDEILRHTFRARTLLQMLADSVCKRGTTEQEQKQEQKQEQEQEQARARAELN